MIKVYDHVLGDDCVCASSKEEAFEYLKEEHGDDYFDTEDTAESELLELSDKELKFRKMYVDEEFEEKVSYYDAFEQHKADKTPTPFILCTNCY